MLSFPDGNYVGQSANVSIRLRNHCAKMEEGIHPNRKIRNGVALHGMPSISVLCYCSLEELNSAENYYMSMYDCYPSGYNLKPGGDYARGVVDVAYQLEVGMTPEEAIIECERLYGKTASAFAASASDLQWILWGVIALLVIAVIFQPLFIILLVSLGIYARCSQ